LFLPMTFAESIAASFVIHKCYYLTSQYYCAKIATLNKKQKKKEPAGISGWSPLTEFVNRSGLSYVTSRS